MKELVGVKVKVKFIILTSLFIIVFLGIMHGRQHYQNQLLFEEFQPEQADQIRYINQVINMNSVFFENPLNQANREQVEAVGNTIHRIPSIEAQTLGVLSVGREWVYNASVTAVIDSGKLVIMVFGLIFGALMTGKSGKKTVGILIRYQTLIYMACILFCWAYFAYYHKYFISNRVLYSSVLHVLRERQVWAPALGSNIMATIAGFWFWTTHLLIGMLFGVFGRNIVILLIVQQFLSQVMFRIFVFYPVSPLYFAHRIIGAFVLMSINNVGGYSHINLGLFFISIAALYYIIIRQFNRNSKGVSL